jgi:hypothetical protein
MWNPILFIQTLRVIFLPKKKKAALYKMKKDEICLLWVKHGKDDELVYNYG